MKNKKIIMSAFLAGILGGMVPGAVSSMMSGEEEKPKLEKIVEKDIKPRFSESKEISYQNDSKFVKVKNNDPLYDKIGFEYEVPKIEFKRIPGTERLPPLGMFYGKKGVEYDFEITNAYRGVNERLSLRFYNDGRSSDGTMNIIDSNKDGKPDEIYIYDWKNNTDIIFNKKRNGMLKFEGPIDKELAEYFYEWCSKIYNNFKKDYNIDQKIAMYSPMLEIKIQEREYKVIDDTIKEELPVSEFQPKYPVIGEEVLIVEE